MLAGHTWGEWAQLVCLFLCLASAIAFVTGALLSDPPEGPEDD